MCRLVILYFVTICISLQIANAANILNFGASDQSEIHQGNCTFATERNLVKEGHVHKSRIPFTTREAEFSWNGDETLFCIIARSLKEASKGSTVKITEGGLYQNFIKLEMHSSTNHGLEYNIKLYGCK